MTISTFFLFPYIATKVSMVGGWGAGGGDITADVSNKKN